MIPTNLLRLTATVISCTLINVTISNILSLGSIVTGFYDMIINVEDCRADDSHIIVVMLAINVGIHY